MLGNYKPEQMEPLFRRIDERLLQIPGVRMVAPALYAPMTGDSWNEGIRVAGRPNPDPRKIRAPAGRASCRASSKPWAQKSCRAVRSDQDTATTRSPSSTKRSRKILQAPEPHRPALRHRPHSVRRNFEIVGVVRDIRYMTWDYKDPIRPMFWLPETQSVKYDDPQFNTFDLFSHFLYNIVIWAPGNPPGIESECAKRCPASIPTWWSTAWIRTEMVSGDFQQENMIATLTMLFGVLGLVLAAVGCTA